MTNHLLFILDDDPFYTSILCAHLEKYNFKIETFTDSVSFFQNIYKSPFLILLDYHLNEQGNGKTGKEIFQEIKSLNASIPIIIISNQDSGQVVLDLIQNGVRNYVEKDSYALKHIDSMIEAHLASQSTTEED